MFGCGGALAPGDAFSSQAWKHLCLYVPCYGSLMVLELCRSGVGGGEREVNTSTDTFNRSVAT